MVKLRGPALSLSASGSIGDAVTISNWKGRHYLKKKSLPTDPKTPVQRGLRTIMSWLAAEWTSLSNPDHQSWSDLAARSSVPAYNAFMSENFNRLNLMTGPTKAYPATETGTLPTFDPFPIKATDGILGINGEIGFDPLNDVWGCMYFVYKVILTPTAIHNLRFIRTHTATDTIITFLGELAPGKWWFNARSFTTDGVLSGDVGGVSADSLPQS